MDELKPIYDATGNVIGFGTPQSAVGSSAEQFIARALSTAATTSHGWLFRGLSNQPTDEEYRNNYYKTLATLRQSNTLEGYLKEFSTVPLSAIGAVLGAGRKVLEHLGVGIAGGIGGIKGALSFGSKKGFWQRVTEEAGKMTTLFYEKTATGQHQIGVVAPLIDALLEAGGVSPMYRRVRWTDANGVIHEDVMRGEFVEDFAKRIMEEGGFVDPKSLEPSGIERGATVVLNTIDFFDPFANLVGGKVFQVGMKTLKYSFKPAVSTANFLGRVVTSPKVGAVINRSGVGRRVSSLVSWLERNAGVGVTHENRIFNAIFAPIRREANARIEYTKRMIQGVENYVTEGGGWIASAIEGGSANAEFGTEFVDTLKTLRERYMKMAESAGEEAAKSAFRKTQALVFFAETGLPLNKEVYDALRLLGTDPETAASVLEKYNVVRSEGLRHLILSGYLPELEGVLENVDELKRLSEQYPDAFRIISAYYDTNPALADVIEILDMPEANIDDIQRRISREINPTIIEQIEKTLPAYKRSVRRKLAVALHYLSMIEDPLERQVVADYIALKMGAAGEISLNNLRRALKIDPSLPIPDEVYYTLYTAAKRFQDAPTEVYSAIRGLMNNQLVDELENLNGLIKRIQDEGIDLSAVFKRCIGAEGILLGGIVGASAVASAKSLIEYLAGHGVEDGNVVAKAEQLLRNEVAQWAATGHELKDELLRRWLDGEVLFAPAAPKGIGEAEQLVSDMADVMGIDYDLFSLMAKAQHRLETKMLEVLDPPSLGVDAKEMFYRWKDYRDAMYSFIGQLEREGRFDVSSRLRQTLDQYDALSQTLHAMFGRPELGTSVYDTLPEGIKEAYNTFFSTYGGLYWRGKSFALDRYTNLIQMRLKEYQDTVLRHTPFVAFFTEEPTFIHTEKIEEGVLKGMYTTPFIANTIASFDENSSIWKGALDLLNNLWKMSAVVWNPIAIVRDFMSNTVAMIYGLDLMPHQWYQIGKYYSKAWHSIKNRDEHFLRMAQQTPSVWGATIQVNELEQELLYQMQSAYPTRRISAMIGNLPILRHLQTLRGMSESVGKLAMYHAAMEKIKEASPDAIDAIAKKFGISKHLLMTGANDLATLVAEKYMLDYQDVSPIIRFLRRYLGVMPFITYEAKMMRLLFETLPERGDALFYFLRAMSLGQKFVSPTEEEKEYAVSVRKVLPQRLHDNPLVVSWYDKESGRAKAIDLSFYVPYGVLMPIHRIMAERFNPDAVLQEIRERIGGVYVPLVEILLNRELFSGRQIYNPEDSREKIMEDIKNHILKETPVPIIPPSVKRWGTAVLTGEDMEKEIRVFGLESIFGVYQIDVNKAQFTVAQKLNNKADALLRDALQAYKREKDPKKAEQIFQHYLSQANYYRTRAEEAAASILVLRNASEEVSHLLLNPVFGYNPNEDYNAQISFLRSVYDYMRATNRLPQKTDKADILHGVVQMAEQMMRYYFLAEAYRSERRNLERWSDSVKEVAKEHMRQSRGGQAVPFPEIPAYTPRYQEVYVPDYAPLLWSAAQQPETNMRPFTTDAGGSVRSQPVDTETALRQWLNAQRGGLPPSIGNIEKPSGRPAGS